MLLGLNEKIKWREIPKWFYIYFILTLILSWLLITPRIYIIWVILLLWNVRVIIRGFILYLWKHYTDLNFRKSYFENRRTLMGSLFSNTDLENFLNPEVMKSMVGCTSDILDIVTRICEVAVPATKVILYPILERLRLLLLEKPESNLRFYFDSSKISVKEEFVKVNKVKVIEEGSKLWELNEIDDVNLKSGEGMKLWEFNNSDWE